MVRRRLGWSLLVAVLAAGCTTSDATQRPGSDHTDVWFAQRMVPHLLQTSAILDLAGEQLTRPKLARLAGAINRQSHVHLQQLQGWLEGRGLAAYDPSRAPTTAKRPTCHGCPGPTGPGSTAPSSRSCWPGNGPACAWPRS